MRVIAPAFATVLAICLMHSAAFADSYDDAIEAGKQGDYRTAVKLLEPLANAGDAQAQGALGYFYDKGLGVPVDHERAFNWYMSAAKQGDAGAEMNLCVSYAEGIGVPKDVNEGVHWCLLAAKQNLAVAHSNLGYAYAYGALGLPKDYRRAYMHFKLAAEHVEQPDFKKLYSEGVELTRSRMSAEEIEQAERMAAAWPQELP